MLKAIGIDSIEKLVADIPPGLRHDLNLPHPMSELELLKELRGTAGLNADLDEYASYLGAGAYEHFIPSAVSHIVGRSEFYTAYTPYQPEASQGTLQAIYEYQSLICQLTGMDVANASLYDGASGVAEAALLALNALEGRSEVLVSEAVHPEYRQVLKTYLANRRVVIREISCADGLTDLKALKGKISDKTACVIVQNPNFFGSVEEMTAFETVVHASGALFIAVVNPISLGILKSPGEYNADVAVGEGQPLGNPVSFGGPYLGFLAVKDQYKRKMPGRIVGVTQDKNGRTGYVLTLQAREQHIRREKATSNICSNEALNALTACVYLSLLGKSGMREAAALNLAKSHYLHEKIAAIPGCKPAFKGPFFNEFVVDLPVPLKKITRYLVKNKVIGGLALGKYYTSMKNSLLICVTETKSREDLDRYAELLAEAVGFAGKEKGPVCEEVIKDA
jgi:glycine dehydrogenase subunit 1